MSLVREETIVTPELAQIATGVNCTVKIGKSCWPGKVAAIGKICVVMNNKTKIVGACIVLNSN